MSFLYNYSSEENSDIEEDDTNENNDDVIQAMSGASSSLCVCTVYTDSDSDPPVNPIIL